MDSNNGNNGKPKKNLAFWISIEVLAITALILYVIVNIAQISSFMDGLNAVLSPVITGLVIAYLCNPILNFYEYRVFRWKKNTKLKKKLCRYLSIFMTIVTAFVIVALVIVMIVPQLFQSIGHFIRNFYSYLESFVAFVNDTVNGAVNLFSEESVEYVEYLTYEEVRDYINEIGPHGSSFSEIMTNVQGWWNENSNIITELGSNILIPIFNLLKNLIIGIFIAFYLLASKELRTAQIKKFRRAVFNDKQNEFITDVVTVADRNFGGYIKGALADAVIVGLMSFIIFELFDISEYNLLIATFIGITNVIPIFGPFIGAIPTAVIVLISNPSKLLLFIVLILVIQQLDGNVIAPKILGDSTNLSSLTVIIAICVLGGLFGIVGMVLAVPLFATVFTIIDKQLDKKLAAKGEPTDTEYYFPKRTLVDTESAVHKERTTWVYRYEHSDVKVRVDSLLERFKKKNKKKKKNESKNKNEKDNVKK